MSYTWNANKNKTSETIAGGKSGYGFTSAGTTYDFEDRLTGFARASGTLNQSWNLTSVGDWTGTPTYRYVVASYIDNRWFGKVPEPVGRSITTIATNNTP